MYIPNQNEGGWLVAGRGGLTIYIYIDRYKYKHRNTDRNKYLDLDLDGDIDVDVDTDIARKYCLQICLQTPYTWVRRHGSLRLLLTTPSRFTYVGASSQGFCFVSPGAPGIHVTLVAQVPTS